MKQYVIIGNGTAAAGCIEGIRKVDRDGSILVISKEDHPVYCRPLISYYLEGKTDLDRIGYRPKDFYEKNNCTVLYKTSVTSIDPSAKCLSLDDGTQKSYDRLCVATGSSPFVPPMEGLDAVEPKYSFLTLDDALALEKAITKDSRVLIIGAGLIGLKCAEGIKKRVRSVTVCDLAPRVLSSILDDTAASIVQKHLEANDIRFLLGDSVASFCKYEEGAGSLAKPEETSAAGQNSRMASCAYQAVLRSGTAVTFDVLVLAVGVRPNLSLVKDAGGACGRAITIDTHMQTSLPDIYAAGDCTESLDISGNAVKIMALLPNAYMQGFCAGQNMAGEPAVFDTAIPMNSIGFFGLHTMTAGTRFEEKDGGSTYEECIGDTIKKLFLKDDVLTGFMLVGNTERAGIYTSLIRNKTPLSTIDFDSLKQSPQLSAFDAAYRKKTLGGVKHAD